MDQRKQCSLKPSNLFVLLLLSLLSKVPARQNVKYLVYPYTYHHFCSSSLPAEMKTFHGTIGYNEKAAKAAWEEVERFLRR